MIAGLDELEIAIHLIKTDNPNLNYQELKKEVNRHFGYDNEIEDYYLIFEPTIEEESFDLQLQYQNLGI